MCLGTNTTYYCYRFIITALVFSTFSIGTSLINIYWNFCLFSQVWSYSNYYLFAFSVFANIFIFNLSAWFPAFFFSFNLFSSYLLSLQYLFKFVTLVYYYLIFLGRCFTFISCYLMILFIPFLNFSINSLSLYSLTLTIFWNTCMNFSIVLLSCFIFFNFTNSANSLFLLLNFFLA